MGKFGFQTASTGHASAGGSVSTTAGTLPSLPGEGLVITAFNNRMSGYQSVLTRIAEQETAVQEAASTQNEADIAFSRVPTPDDIKDQFERARKAVRDGGTGSEEFKHLQEMKDERQAGYDAHQQASTQTETSLHAIEYPSVPGAGTPGDSSDSPGGPGGHWGGADDGLTDWERQQREQQGQRNGDGGSSSEGSAGGSTPGASAPSDISPTTHTSSDLSASADPVTRLSSSPTGQPQFPPAALGQAQGQGAGPGAGGFGMGPTPVTGTDPLKDLMNRNKRKQDAKDSKEDGPAVLAGLGGAGAGALGAAGVASLDRGHTVTGVQSPSAVNGAGVSAPTQLSGSGTDPNNPKGGTNAGPMGPRGMGGSGVMGSGAGLAGATPAKKRTDDTPSATPDPKLIGYDAIRESVPGGIAGRDTSAEMTYQDWTGAKLDHSDVLKAMMDRKKGKSA